MTGTKLEAARSGCEGSKSDGEVHQLMRPITHGNDFRIGLGDATRVILFFGHTINDVFFLQGFADARLVDGADYVDLVVLPGMIAAIDVDDVVGAIDAKEGVGGVPMNVMHPLRRIRGGGQVQHGEDHEGGIPL